jgi:hypothetical protein
MSTWLFPPSLFGERLLDHMSGLCFEFRIGCTQIRSSLSDARGNSNSAAWRDESDISFICSFVNRLWDFAETKSHFDLHPQMIASVRAGWRYKRIRRFHVRCRALIWKWTSFADLPCPSFYAGCPKRTLSVLCPCRQTSQAFKEHDSGQEQYSSTGGCKTSLNQKTSSRGLLGSRETVLMNQ